MHLWEQFDNGAKANRHRDSGAPSPRRHRGRWRALSASSAASSLTPKLCGRRCVPSQRMSEKRLRTNRRALDSERQRRREPVFYGPPERPGTGYRAAGISMKPDTPTRARELVAGVFRPSFASPLPRTGARYERLSCNFSRASALPTIPHLHRPAGPATTPPHLKEARSTKGLSPARRSVDFHSRDDHERHEGSLDPFRWRRCSSLGLFQCGSVRSSQDCPTGTATSVARNGRDLHVLLRRADLAQRFASSGVPPNWRGGKDREKSRARIRLDHR